ncbi:mitochondrial ribosome assembly protein RRG9 [Lachancea thermotolerans CBS 6340]|uniref:Required for respiratory growth protein 9, mitochondrial n=1 Tax=Lachancea thermotolerans (strain ATCC 56472 / CBS 6340 / NRRL Y-8284) TaxID=559295 RepID=RRG9_LACTC|nr:KLTH0B07876p [Lachancea thermotolerans CBS 6340]C5DD31.1 RecName: Full=Required for respiratory growth protein 9, mitochondrial; Flags: Precursor [Lachancea thermotolerans CBS 6340]CAR21692.1 KLTH0B07876p [Lachancea thermotolerans CBS 6340]
MKPVLQGALAWIYAGYKTASRGHLLPYTRHQKFHSSSLISEQAKRAKDLIKLVNSSSLSNSESQSLDWRSDLKVPEWKRQKLALKDKFKGQQWNPKKKLSREQMENVRLLKRHFPETSATELSERFQVSPEVIRRILKSKWQPNEEEQLQLQTRWKRRSERVNEILGSPEHQKLPPKKLVLGSGRTDTDLQVKSVRRTAVKAGRNSSSPKGKQKLNLLSKLIS